MEQEAPKRMTIAEIEHILNHEEDDAIEILPNGEVRRKGDGEKISVKPLTMRENLGGEYSLPMAQTGLQGVGTYHAQNRRKGSTLRTHCFQATSDGDPR